MNRSSFLTLLFSAFCIFSYAPVVGQGGYCLDFNGTSDYLSVPHHADLAISGTAITLEAWIFPTSWQANYWDGSIIVKEELSTTGYMLRVGDNGTIGFSLGNGSSFYHAVSPSGTLSLNQWQHVAGVLDGTNMTVYVNGKAVGTQTFSGSIATNTATLSIGITEIYASRWQEGKIEEVRIWNDARSAGEIQANMYKTLTGAEANLVAYYNMDAGTGTTVTDATGNGHTASFGNSPTWKTSGALAGPGMALDFDGTDDFVAAPLNASSSPTLTVETWVSFNSLTGQQNLMNVHSDANTVIRFVPYKTAANEIYLYIYDGSATYNIPTTFTVTQTDEWHHLVFIYDDGTVQIYADGELVGSETGQGSFNTGVSSTFSMGADYNGTAAGFHSNVKMDEVRIWSDVRTASEIRANMHRTLDGDEAGLLSYYRCDQQPESGNTTVYDYSNSGHNATLSFMDATTDWVASTPFNTWIGSEDSDWANADNWSWGTVPAGENVGIYSWSGSNDPASNDISANDFYVDAGVTVSHSGDLTLGGDFYNAGSFTTTGRVTVSGSAAQTIGGTAASTFGTFVINNSAGVTLDQNVAVTSGITLTDGVVDLNGNVLTLNSAASVSGVPGASNHIKATSGTLRKGYSSTGSFTFPVGDGTNYSPIALNFTSGSFASAYADVDLTTGKHPSNSSASHYINRYWTVSSSGISGFSCDVSATYVNGDIVGTESELYGGKWSSGWTVLGPVTTGSNLISGTVSGFSDFTAGELSAFPVEWLSFEATPVQNQVNLAWTTASEMNSDYYAVERSADSETWAEIGQLSAAGFTTEESRYAFTDETPSFGENFYRLRQVDFDGRVDYSEVRSVWIQAGVKLYPNPVTDVLNLELPAGNWSATMFDQTGREVRRIPQAGSSIDMNAMPSGVYHLMLINDAGQRLSERVIRK